MCSDIATKRMQEEAVYVYVMKYHSAVKMNEISSLAAMRMDSDMIIRSGGSQAKTKITRYLQAGSKLVQGTYLQNEIDLQTQKTDLCL